MPKIITKKPQTHESHTDLEPSKAWIRNLGAGTTKVMPKHKWAHKNPSGTINKTKFKGIKSVLKRPAHLPNQLYDSISTIYCMNARSDRQKKLPDKLPTLKRVLNNYFDDTVASQPHESVVDIMNDVYVSEAIQLSTPVNEASIELNTLDFSSSSNLYDIKLNDILPSLPFCSTGISSSFSSYSSSLSPKDSFTQMDEASHDLSHMDFISGKHLKVNRNWSQFEHCSNIPISFHCILLHFIPVKMESNCSSNISDDYLSLEVPTCAQLSSDNVNQSTDQLDDISWPLLTQATNQEPQASSLSTDAFVHTVYMRDDDVSHLIQSGHIFYIKERLHYKHKNNV